MFETAIRNHYRFSGPLGFATCEDLWDLDLGTLNGMATGLFKELKSLDETPDFLGSNSEAAIEGAILRTKLDIVKRVIEVKLADAKAAEEAKAAREDRQLLIDLLHEKKLEQKKEMTVEELVEALDQ